MCSFPCSDLAANNGSSWWSPMVSGGEGGGWGCWVRFWGRRWKQNGCFMLLDVFVACKTSHVKFCSLGRADPT